VKTFVTYSNNCISVLYKISVPYFGTHIRKYGTHIPNNGTKLSYRDKKTFTPILHEVKPI